MFYTLYLVLYIKPPKAIKGIMNINGLKIPPLYKVMTTAAINPIMDEKLNVGRITLWDLKYSRLILFNIEKPINTKGMIWVIFKKK